MECPEPIEISCLVEAKLQSENPQEYAKLMTFTLVGKKRQKGSSEEEKSGLDKDGRKFVRYNIYQHHQLANILVRSYLLKFAN